MDRIEKALRKQAEEIGWLIRQLGYSTIPMAEYSVVLNVGEGELIGCKSYKHCLHLLRADYSLQKWGLNILKNM